MNKWFIVAIIGVVLLAIGLGLSIYGTDYLGGVVSSTLSSLKSESFSSLPPGKSISIVVPSNTIMLVAYNSTAPIEFNSTITQANGIYLSEVTSTTTPSVYSFTNNYTHAVDVKYVVKTIDISKVEMAGIGVILVFVGLIIAIIAGIIGVISYFRKKRQTGMPPSPPTNPYGP
ncbi:hypothetical protein [Sulfuracidifex metallicus]|uniref:Uncharacterized protein n=1 Tax=Sulfuracidifex metallicus DSM 6482 = JCM 9184 TaxID=523847 RepID=A0A6A9QPC7_SULME|nr:hypothetical protein [Sulfuracidifex metallicus]MUN29598.1 hypothetical protein [Sulfuracidifex metallicus DSM 6482 = JCM 9184]WOE49890.1 hypothetical protein RQ359_001382 [Sulfuracidifex metallicus DSM 6482 = JCM 9184]